MYRYLAIIGDPRNVESVRAFQELRPALSSKSSDWQVAYEDSCTLLVHKCARHSQVEAYVLANSGGLILGKLFDRQRTDYATAQRVRFDVVESDRVRSTCGQHLIDHYWGSYVALLADKTASAHHVFRDPTGGMECYHTRYRGLDLLFSDIQSCLRFISIPFSINSHYLVRWLIYSGQLGRETGLQGVQRLQGGERLTLRAREITRSNIWDPTEIAQRPPIERPDEAAEKLRSTVQLVTDAWSSCYRRITHKLSGGLDSSILAGCLAHSPSKPDINYLNVSIDIGFDEEYLHLPGLKKDVEDKLRAIAGHGDERYFARLVATRWSRQLIERKRANSMDLKRLWNASMMASPAMYFTMMDVDDIELELAKSWETQAFFSGQGGDSVLFATSQPFPAIDYCYLHKIRSGLWRQVLDTAQLSKQSAWAVLAQAIKHGLLNSPYRSPIAPLEWPTLLNHEAKRQLTEGDFVSDVAELVARSKLPPGKQAHVQGLAGCAYQNFVFFSGEHADHIDPLNSQPVWEVALRIPTYALLSGGTSRGLARRAFADLLPREIRTRQVKGTGTPFYQRMVRSNMDFLRQHLADGELVRRGYLDGARLDACLRSEEPFAILPAATLLSYLAAEIWLRQWSDASRNAICQHSAAS